MHTRRGVSIARGFAATTPLPQRSVRIPTSPGRGEGSRLQSARKGGRRGGMIAGTIIFCREVAHFGRIKRDGERNGLPPGEERLVYASRVIAIWGQRTDPKAHGRRCGDGTGRNVRERTRCRCGLDALTLSYVSTTTLFRTRTAAMNSGIAGPGFPFRACLPAFPFPLPLAILSC